MPVPSRNRTLRWLAITTAGVEVAIHAGLAPGQLQETPSIGVLFVIAAVLLTATAVALTFNRDTSAAWLVGALVCSGMFAGFILSRTIGLPDYREGWTSDGALGPLSLAGELIFLGCALHAVRIRRAAASAPYPVRIEDREDVHGKHSNPVTTTPRESALVTDHWI